MIKVNYIRVVVDHVIIATLKIPCHRTPLSYRNEIHRHVSHIMGPDFDVRCIIIRKDINEGFESIKRGDFL
jgi:hypothetical protein